MDKKLKVVFFGTPEFSVPTLDLLNNHPNVDLAWVISMPDRPAGRGHQLKSPEVIEYAKNNKINYFQTNNINKEIEFIAQLKQENIDFFVVLAFAQFLNKDLLSIPRLGCFNIHTSLLPKYRGAAPIQYAILNGDTKTGVSIQKMVLKMDAGDIVKESHLDISDDETGGQLYTRLKFQSALCLNDFISDIISNNITLRPQSSDNITFAPTLQRTDGKLEFSKEDFFQLKNKVRALYPWPGTYCNLNNKRLKIFKILPVDDQPKLTPGSAQIVNGMIYVGCIDKTVRLFDIQLEGKKRSFDTDLVNGLQDKIITIS